MFVSYAQNFEDVILHRALGSVSDGFYIDIGASHPDIDSVSRSFHENGWRGIHVEPVPAHAAALRHARPGDVVVEAVVTDEVGTLTFFDVGLGAGISTCSAEYAERHRAAGFSVSTYPVEQVSLFDIMNAHVSSDVHWMKIDVEGHEGAVIRSWRDSNVRPWIVLVESTEPNSMVPNYEDWEPEILRRGYRFVYFDGLNRFYLAEDHAELAVHFSCGPNLFDNFTVRPHHWLCPPPSPPQSDKQGFVKARNFIKKTKRKIRKLLGHRAYKIRHSKVFPSSTLEVAGGHPGKTRVINETLQSALNSKVRVQKD